MLFKIKRLVIENKGHKRKIYFDNIYLNSSAIISVIDYSGAREFLLSENSKFASEKFSLIKISEGDKVQEFIAFGSADQIYSNYGGDSSKKRILNG